MSLVITATKKNAGKTMVGIGIGLHHPESTGFFKPLGTNLVRGKDEDVLLYKEIFNLKEGEQEIPTYLAVFLIGRKIAHIR